MRIKTKERLNLVELEAFGKKLEELEKSGRNDEALALLAESPLVTGPVTTGRVDLFSGGASPGATTALYLAKSDDDHTADPPSAVRAMIDSVRDTPEKWRRVKAFVRRVNELVDGVTDEELGWALSRFKGIKSQEGILRQTNDALVNKWPMGKKMFDAAHDDFAESSLSDDSIQFIFKQAMDREEPAFRYGWTAAGSLHDHLPNVAHFMGNTLQERVLGTALKGVPPKLAMSSVWVQEEMRHGPVMEQVYNASRGRGRPELKQQGISSKDPTRGAYSCLPAVRRSACHAGGGLRPDPPRHGRRSAEGDRELRTDPRAGPLIDSRARPARGSMMRPSENRIRPV